MNREEYFSLMRFPPEWLAWEMIPNLLIAEQAAAYEPGHEEASEHDRHSVFQWWLRQPIDSERLVKLAKLSWLDPDQKMGAYVRKSIAGLANDNKDVVLALSIPYHRA